MRNISSNLVYHLIMGQKCLSATILVLLISTQIGAQSVCDTSECKREAEVLNARIDRNVDPCTDFYQFACGKYLNTSTTDEEPELTVALFEQGKNKLLEHYDAPATEDEHIMVKSAKKLYQACINTTAIEEDNLKTIKEALQTVGGGWPLVVGSKWDETKFDWLQATYKLRELGYPFNVFFDLVVDADPRNKTRSIFKIRIPFHLQEAVTPFSYNRNVIEKVISAFGADENNKSEELEELLEFGETFRMQTARHKSLTATPVYTMAEVQNSLGSINWLQFVNTISRIDKQVSVEDHAVLVDEIILRERLNTISHSSKRAQANYMMWKLVQKMAPYLTSEIRDIVPKESEEKGVERKDFCLKTVQERFIPNPIVIKYNREHLPVQQRRKIEDLVNDMKTQFLKQVDKLNWITKEDKENVIDKINSMTVIVGDLDENYEYSALDHSNVDMRKITNENVLNLLTQANRNHLSQVFKETQSSKLQEILSELFDSKFLNIYYIERKNILRLATSHLQYPLFDGQRPNYFNYGMLGTEVATQLSALLKLYSSYFDKYGNEIKRWSSQTMEGYNNISECLISNMKDYKQLANDFVVLGLQDGTAGSQLAYKSYLKWVKDNGMELPPLNVNYTADQLFWISTTQCRHGTKFENTFGSYQSDYTDYFRTLATTRARNSPDFAKDFNCPSGSPMNPLDKCYIL